MWGAIKAAASKIISVFKPPAPKPTPPGVTKPIGTIGAGGLQPTYNPQGNNYNPQQGAPSPQSTWNPQGGAVSPQGSNSYALTQQRLAVQRAQQQQIEIQTALRKAEAERVRKQGVQDEFAKMKASWLDKGNKLVDAKKQPGKQNWFGKVVDFVTLGGERRAGAARKWAQGQGNDVATNGVKAYETNLNSFLAEQAKRKAAVEGSKFRTEADYKKAVNDYNTWEAAKVKGLEAERAKTAGLLEAYSGKSQEAINTPLAKAAGWVGNHVIAPIGANSLWKYTLGDGSKNVPSVVTAPSRLLNTVGNWLHPNQTINQYGGTSINRTKAGLNPWQASFNQRNTNLAPYIDKPFDAQNVKNLINKGQVRDYYVYAQKYKAAGTPAAKEKILRAAWDDYQAGQRNQNTITEMVRDPLNLAAGAGVVAKLAKGSKFVEAAKATKVGSWLARGAEATTAVTDAAKARLAGSKAVQWLSKPAENRAAVLARTVEEAKAAQTAAQGKYLPAARAIAGKLATKSQLDYNVLDELGKLSDSEAKMLQRMVNGNLSFRDRAMLSGRGLAPIRDKLTGLAERYKVFSDQMATSDNITAKNSRFLGGKKQYFANTSWLPQAERKANGISRYNFRAFKKSNYLQDSAQLHRSQVDRLFKSDLEKVFAQGEGGKRAALMQKMKDTFAAYDQSLAPHKAAVETAYGRTRSPIGRLQALNSKISPLALWKKSVLKYRPAWTVNNVLYNTQAGVLAGGGRSLVEQGKMLNPRYWRKAMDSIPANVKADVAGEMGKGRLNKFYNGVENWSRVAAFRAAKAKGMTDAQALKRVNKYLFDYKTKNWERPFKAVMPFWGFQKGLAKAAVTMPLDRPAAAIGYNRLGRYQDNQFNQEFEHMRKQLKDMGYSDSEIDGMKTDMAKYYKGRLKVGGKWITTPFNAFSDRGMSTGGVNPFVAAASETALSQDSFGTKIKGATLGSRLLSKFPQAELARKGWLGHKVDTGQLKPREGWIAAPGSEGYGLGKERQGFDPKAANYSRNLDPRAKLSQDAAAFLGVPRSIDFSKDTFLQRKLMAKVKEEYFKTDWKSMDYPTEQAKQAELFKKWGVTPDQFFKGELAKYDTANTKAIKLQKEEARTLTGKLYAEYGAQPKGTRNIWATKKLKELVDSGYFDKNPFLKSFDWTNPGTIAKAYRQLDYQSAKASGDLSKWNSKYGDKRSPKAAAYRHAIASGDWSAYRAKYGVKDSPKAKFWGAYFATTDKTKRRAMIAAHPEMGKPKTPQEVAATHFWASYMAADPNERKALIKQHPEFNTRKDWTKSQWLTANAAQGAKDRANILSSAPAATAYTGRLATNWADAARIHGKVKRASKLVWKL